MLVLAGISHGPGEAGRRAAQAPAPRMGAVPRLPAGVRAAGAVLSPRHGSHRLIAELEMNFISTLLC